MIAMPKLFSDNKVNPNVFQAAIARIFKRSWAGNSAGKRSERPPQRRKILFESLEPRLLLSADFMPAAPLGTLIHQSSQSGNLIIDSVAPYTFSLDAGQKISVVFDTEDADLQGRFELYDVSGGGETLVTAVSAVNPGEMATLDSYYLDTPRDYRLDVRNLNTAGDGGAFNLEMYLNATLESETLGGAGNNDIGSAQDLAPSEVTLPGGGLRYAAVGLTQAGEADYYQLELDVDQMLSLGLAAMTPGTGNALRLELLDAAGNLITLGDASPSNFDQMISGYKAAAGGAYLLKVSGSGGENYSLVAVKQTRLEHEANGQAAQAQNLGATPNVLGSLGGKGASGQVRVAVVGTINTSYNAGLQGIVDQLNNDTWFDFSASLITPVQADTLQELQQYDAVVVGGARYSTTEFAAYASALRSYVEAGGGLVTTGWGIYSAQGLSGQTRTDFDAIVPVNVSGSYDDYGYNTLFVPTGTHPILDGITSFFTGTYTQYPTASPQVDPGATLLGTENSRVAAAAADIGAGHSVYLGPIYAGYSSSWNTAALRTGMADRLLEQAVAWAAFGGKDVADNYLVSAAEGDVMNIATSTPAWGGAEPDNSLDALIELYNPAGTLVASNDNDPAGDGHNALLSYTVQAGEAGQFRVRVTPVAGSGDYVLNVTGTSGATTSPPEVVTSSLAENVVLPSEPVFLDITFSEAVDLSSVQASDLTLTGPSVSAVATNKQVLGERSLRFDIAGLTGDDGLYTLSLSGINDLAGEAMVAYSQDFSLDTTGPSIVDVTPATSTAPGSVTLDFTFDQDLNTSYFDSGAIRLHEQLSNQDFYAFNASYDNANRRASFMFEALPEGNYQVFLASSYIRDAVSNTLTGGDYTGTLIIDNDAGLSMPTPLQAQAPFGSLIHSTEAVGAFHATGDVDDYSITLAANQTLSVALFPVDDTFRGRIEVFDPYGNRIADFNGNEYFDAANPGDVAGLNALPATDSGLYLIRVSSLEGAGRYTVKLLLNAAAEEEMIAWANNDELANAQDLTPSLIQLDVDGASRAAVSGRLEAPRFISDQPMLLGTLGRGGNPSTLVELDPTTGAVIRSIGSIGYSVNGLEYVTASGNLYGTVSSQDSNAPGYLIQIDLTTGAGTPIGSGSGVGTLVNLTSDSAGNLFAWDQDSENLVAIDPVTGEGVVVGDAGIGTWTHGLAFDGDDNLYFVNGGGEFYQVDPATGVATYLFDVNQTAHHGDFDPLTGRFFGVGNTDSTTPLVIIDVVNQTVVASHETGVQLHTVTFTSGSGERTVPQDWYSFSMPANDVASLVLAGENADQAQLELYDVAGNRLATGSADASNTAWAIRNFRAPDDGVDHTYYVRISGNTPGDYNLVVTRNYSAFEREDNGVIAQDISQASRVLGYQSGVISVDRYQFQAVAGDTVTISTSTPGDSGGEPGNVLNPALALHAPDGSLVPSTDYNEYAFDGRNVVIEYTIATDGAYTVEVTATDGAGAYTLLVDNDNASGVDPSPVPLFQVASSLPWAGASLPGYPASYRVTLSEQVLLTSVDAGDLTINGTPADSVTVVDGNTLEFSIGSADIGEALYNVEIADSALVSLSGLYITGWSTTFNTDFTAPKVSATSENQFTVLDQAARTLTFTFDEAISATGLGIEDVTLLDQNGSPVSITSFAYDAINLQASIGIPFLAEGDYTLTLRSGNGAFEDVAGNDLDGENDWLPSGDGVAGGDYVFHFTVDATTLALPVPLGAIQPDGSLIYDTAHSGIFHAEFDEDRYTLEIEAGQVLTVVLSTGDSVLGYIALWRDDGSGNLDENDEYMGEAWAPGHGRDAVLQTVRIETSGTYILRVIAERGAGTYQVQALLNAAREVETLGLGGWNETIADAQSIEGSFIDLDGDNGVAGRATVRGELAGTINFNVAVDGMANVFTAGRDYAYNGLLPTALGFAAGAGNVFTFPAITGLVSFGGLPLFVGPDGYADGQDTTDILSSADPTDTADNYPGISGIINGHGDASWPDYATYPVLGYEPGKTMFLTGVFLGDDLPGSTPDRLDFTNNTNFASLSPQLGQTFYIGDGRMLDGTTLQQFTAPEGATRLFLGFADALDFGYPSSEAGFYDDNYGALHAQVQLNDDAVDDVDWYSFGLQAHETATITLSRDDPDAAGNVVLELYNAAGSLIGTGATDSGTLDSYIKDFTAAVSGTYYLRVSGAAGAYSVVATRNSDFDLELPSQGQDITLTQTVLGYVGGAGSGDYGTGPSGSTGLGINLYDATGYLWDIRDNGNISNGIYDAYDGGMVLNNGFPGYSTAQTEEGGREIVIGTASIGGLEFTRKIYVPTDQSYARFLEIVHNQGGSTVNYTLPIFTNLGSDGYEPFTLTSSGDAAVTPADNWLVTDDTPAGESSGTASNPTSDPVVTHVVAGDDAEVRPTTFTKSSDNVSYSYNISLAPGETKIVMHFASQAGTQAVAVARAEELANLGLNVLYGMSAAERNAVVNFAVGDTDQYLFAANLGDALVIDSSTPGDGASEPGNNLDVAIVLHAPDGSVIDPADYTANYSPDGRNEHIEFTAAVGGFYRVNVSAENGSSGAYLLKVSGSTANLDRTPPTVSSSLLNGNTAEGAIVPPGDLTYTATFSEELASAGLGAEDVSLTNLDTGLVIPLATNTFDYDPVSSTLTLNYLDLAEGNYRLTLLAAADGFRDTQDNLLDGNGDGFGSDSFLVNFRVDAVGATPLQPLQGIAPAGSLMFDPPASGHLFGTADADDYTISLDAGQKSSVRVTPAEAGLQIQVELIGLDGSTMLGTANAAAGQTVLLQNVAIAATGTYTVRISSLAGSGAYETQLVLNAQLENEAWSSSDNSAQASAEELNGSAIGLSGSADRLGVLGNVTANGNDWYSFSLAAGQSASLVATRTDLPADSGLNLYLYDANGTLQASGIGDAGNVDQSISNFIAPTTGTYYARISSASALPYSLVVTRSAEFGLETNGQAQDISSTGQALGALGVSSFGSSNLIRVAVLNSGHSAQVLSQLNDDSYFNFTATSVGATAIDTLAELNNYDVVVIGDQSNRAALTSIAPALRQWVEGGGGVVGSGWLAYAAGVETGTPIVDINAIMPVDTSSRTWNYNALLDINSVTHPVTQEVSDFTVPYYTELPVNGVDMAGALTLASSSGYAAVVVGEPGAGRSVYLGPVYTDSPSGFASGNADRLLEQAVAWAAGDRSDRYTFQATAGQEVSITTRTPGDGAGEPVNLLDARIEVYAPAVAAATLFSDNFDSGASASWGNEVGNWADAEGVYSAQLPSNNPATYTSLPNELGDFSLELDINNTQDGGVWLRASGSGGSPSNGVLLVTGGDGGTGTGLYWHTISNGVGSAALNRVNGLFTPGVSDAHLRITVVGDTYQVFVNGSATAATTLTTSAFTTGRVGLYDYSGQTFDNVVLSSIATPVTLIASNDNGAADGRNASLTFTPALSGVYEVRVITADNTPAASRGDYLLQVTGANSDVALDAVPFVVASNPVSGTNFIAPPATLTLTFSEALLASSVQASDLLLDNGASATAVECVDGRTLRFTLDITNTEGTFNYSLAAGVMSDLQGTGNQAHTGNFHVDHSGPQVVAESDDSNAAFNRVDLSFNELLDAATVSTADIASFTGPGGVNLLSQITGVSVVNGNILRVSFNNQYAEGDYTLVLTPTLTDAVGNLMNQDGNATNGESGSDGYTAVVHVNSVDLIAPVVTAPASANFGQNITVNWKGHNDLSAPATANWYDYVILSRDNLLGSGDNYIAYSYPGAQPLAGHGDYDASVSFNLPLDQNLTEGTW